MNDLNELPLMLDVKQVADVLDMNPNSVRRALQNGTIVGDKVGGKWLVCKETLFMNAAGKAKEATARAEDGERDAPAVDLPDPPGIPSTVLRDLRKEAGFATGKAFAEAAGLPYGSYMAYEKDPSAMTLSWAMRLADYYDVPLDDIVGRERPDPAVKANPVQAFYDGLSSEGRSKLEGFMRYIEYCESTLTPNTPRFMKAGAGEMLG